MKCICAFRQFRSVCYVRYSPFALIKFTVEGCSTYWFILRCEWDHRQCYIVDGSSNLERNIETVSIWESNELQKDCKVEREIQVCLTVNDSREPALWWGPYLLCKHNQRALHDWHIRRNKNEFPAYGKFKCFLWTWLILLFHILSLNFYRRNANRFISNLSPYRAVNLSSRL